MNYFLCAGGKSTHTATKIDVAKTPLASFESNVSGLFIPEILAYITATQSGTGDPSPSNPRAISGVSSVDATVCGVNLWDEEWEVGSIKTATGQPELYGTNRIRSKNYIPCKEVQLYVVTPITLYLYFYDANKTYLGSASIITISMSGTKTFTPPAGAKFLKFRTDNNYGTTYSDNISINYPATDTAYHAYTGTTATTDLGGTYYGGYVNVTTGLLTVTHEKKVLNGSENWQLLYNGSSINQLYIAEASAVSSSSEVKTICDKFKSIKITDRTGNYDTCYTGAESICFNVQNYTVSTWKSWLADNNVTVVYELATPQTYQLTPAQVTQLLGQNNVFCSTGDVAVKGWKID